VLVLLLVGFWGDSSNPNFYNKVGIKGCPDLHIAGLVQGSGTKMGRILRQIQFVGGTTDAGGAHNILL